MNSQPSDAVDCAETELDGHFHAVSQIGQGAFSVLLKATRSDDNVKCVLKMIKLKKNGKVPNRAYYEAACMSRLHHDNILKIYGDVAPISSYYIVYEFAGCDLKKLLEMVEPKGILPSDYVKSFMRQMLSAISYCHARMPHEPHIDLKPKRIFVSDAGVIKIAGFGRTSEYMFYHHKYDDDWDYKDENADDELVLDTASLWYQSPELFIGKNLLVAKSDMWSLGCIFAELASGRTLFQGEDRETQMKKICEVLGTQNEMTIPGISKLELPEKEFNLQKLEEASNLTGHGSDLLQGLLRFPQDLRLSASDALDHPFFLENESTTSRPTVTDLLSNLNVPGIENFVVDSVPDVVATFNHLDLTKPTMLLPSSVQFF